MPFHPRMNLKKLNLDIQSEMEILTDKELNPNGPSLKALQEAARQLGVKFETEELIFKKRRIMSNG